MLCIGVGFFLQDFFLYFFTSFFQFFFSVYNLKPDAIVKIIHKNENKVNANKCFLVDVYYLKVSNYKIHKGRAFIILI